MACHRDELSAPTDERAFPRINRAYDAVFRPRRLSLGLVAPLESYATGPVPSMREHVERAQLVDELGFSAIWLRDVPFNVPSFGDAGQLYDPFVYLGFLAGTTARIALGVASIVLPLRHPAHVAKAAASVDDLSGGRLLLGVASGDRPEEYPAHDVPFSERGERFRESFRYIRHMAEDAPSFENFFGAPRGMDMLPQPTARKLPLLITGGSQQEAEWLASNGDGWMIYPRAVSLQARIIRTWRERMRSNGEPNKPVMQPLYVDLVEDRAAPPEPIHLGFRSGSGYLRSHLLALEDIGVNHVALNLRFNRGDFATTVKRIADEVLPEFSAERSVAR